MRKVSFTSNSETLATFAIRCAVFFTPLLGLLALATGSLYFAGELKSPAEVIRTQELSTALYWPTGQPRSFLPGYKLAGATVRRPEVLLLGSSRANTVRSEFVREPSVRFYNAAVWGADAAGFARAFLEHLPQDCLPHRLILSIDPWWFHRNVPVQPKPDFFQQSDRAEIIDFSWRTGLWWLTQPQAYTTPARIGILAKERDSGLRPDGTFLAAPSIIATMSATKESQLREVEEDTNPWFRSGSPDVSAPAVAEIRQLLAYCAIHQIAVIGYMPPLNPALYKFLRNDQQRQFSFQVASALEPVFRQRRFPFFDLQDPARSGCSAAEFSDLFHESEVCSVRNLLAMARRDPRVLAIIDPAKLEALLACRKSDLQLAF